MNYNKKNLDGSVNSFYITKEPGHGFFVPVSSKLFCEQIEEDILPSVLHLTSVGFKTITSCHGHSLYNYLFKNAIRFNFGPQVTVEVNQFDGIRLLSLRNFFVKTIENKTIEFDNVNKMYISFRIRFFLNFFFTNKFLCNQLYKAIQNV
jgi:hypothetical protein